MNKSSLVLSSKKELLSFLLLCAATPSAQADLTLHRVMLSAAGVGYFELDDHLAGPGTLGLDVPLDQVDDLLRSLVVFDEHGGIGSIELPGRDDAHHAFADVPFEQTMLNSTADMLASLRGEEVAVTGPASMTGRILGAASEAMAEPPGQTRAVAATRTRVTLLTGEGFRQFILEDAASVRLTNAALASRVGAALEAARVQAASTSRHFSLRLAGGAPGRVSVGYVTAVPLWKASYRLVLPQAEGDTARVQGWAVLENQSGQDWKGVDLTLHAGNPVTFHQAIYASYYADRPEVPVDVIGRILPDADERVLAKAQQPILHRPGSPSFQEEQRFAPPPPPPAPMNVPPPAPSAMGGLQMSAPAEPTDTAETVLDTSFHVAAPIDLARGHTASVPILDRQMKAEQWDWLQAHATRPISAVRLTNDGTASLPPGVLTLYTQAQGAGIAFAGDARLSGLPVGESRLLGFAEDLRMTATRAESEAPETLMEVSIAQGMVHRTVRHRRVYTVNLTAPAHDARRVLVEFPLQVDTTLSFEGGGMPGLEETARAWRVPVSLKAGERSRVVAYADTVAGSEEELLADGVLDDAVLAGFSSTAALDARVRAALQPLIEMQKVVAARQAALKQLAAGQEAASADEERIRNNLRVVVGPGDLHEKLLTQLAGDETRLDDLRIRLAAAQAAEAEAHEKLANGVENLTFPANNPPQ